MLHADDGTLHAYLDGELSALERARLEAHVAECAPCRARLEEERGVISRASQILALAEPPEHAAPPLHQLRHPRPAWRIRTPLVWAASLVISLGAGWLAFGTRSDRADFGAAPAARFEAESRAAADTAAPLTAPRADRPAAAPVAVGKAVAPSRDDVAIEQARVDTAAIPQAAPTPAEPRAAEPPAAAVSGVARLPTDELDLDAARTMLGGEVQAISGVAIDAVRRVGGGAIVVEQQVAPGVVVHLREVAERVGQATVTTEPGPERIVGRVTDATSGAPVANAQVAVTGTPLGAVTSEGGAFAIDSVAPGTYSLQARMAGYEPALVSAARVESGRTTAVEISLKQSLVALDAVVVTSAQEARGRRQAAARADTANAVPGAASGTRLTRRIGQLRVEISGPLPPDSLRKLLERLAPIR